MSITGVNSNYYSANTGRTSNASNEDSKIFDQILDNAKESLSEDISQIVIKLEPSSLGKLSIKISAEAGITVARFDTDNEIVKNVLNDNLEELQNMLKDKGFLVQKTIVTLDSEESESDSQIVDQIVKNIENSLSKNTPEMVIKMKPESLGDLSIRVYSKDDIEFAEFLADTNSVKNAIHANFDGIKEALKSKDFNVQRYVISVKDQDGESQDSGNKNEELNKDPNKMDKDMFLKLLVTQLSNQDPLNPIEDREFIAQMAQFSSLEQMQQVNQNIQLNNIILDQINESLKGQYKSVNEALYHINSNITNSFDKLSKNFDNLNSDQNESLDNDLKVINQLININKAIEGYDMGGNSGS